MIGFVLGLILLSSDLEFVSNFDIRFSDFPGGALCRLTSMRRWTRRGGEVKDTVDAGNEEEAQQKIRQMGYFVTTI